MINLKRVGHSRHSILLNVCILGTLVHSTNSQAIDPTCLHLSKSIGRTTEGEFFSDADLLLSQGTMNQQLYSIEQCLTKGELNYLRINVIDSETSGIQSLSGAGSESGGCKAIKTGTDVYHQAQIYLTPGADSSADDVSEDDDEDTENNDDVEEVPYQNYAISGQIAGLKLTNLETQKSKTWGKTADEFIIDQFGVDSQGQIDGSRIVGFYGSQDGPLIRSLGLVIFSQECAYAPVNGDTGGEETDDDDDDGQEEEEVDDGAGKLVFSSVPDVEEKEEEVNPGNLFPYIPLEVQYIVFFIVFNCALFVFVIGCCVCYWRC